MLLFLRINILLILSLLMLIPSSNLTSRSLRLLRQATNHYHAVIISARWLYSDSLISSYLSYPRLLWKSVNHSHHHNATFYCLRHLIPKPYLKLLLISSPTKFKSFISLFNRKLKILPWLNLHLLNLLPFLKSFIVLVLFQLLNFLNLYPRFPV